MERKNTLTKTAQKQALITENATRIYAEHKGILGYRKMHAQLWHEGVCCCRETVRKICKKSGLISCVYKKRKRARTTITNPKDRVDMNLLNREFTVSAPNQVYLTDITYIHLANGDVCYLCAVEDLFSRRILGWSLADNMRTEFVIDALSKAIKTCTVLPHDVMLHSDRGVQYTSTEFREVLSLFGITQSMSGKGECWDNAPCESFWGKLKQEWLRQRPAFKTMEELDKALFEYIEVYYCSQRLHQSLGYKTPLEAEQEFYKKEEEKSHISIDKSLTIL
jgi:putative transposase